MLDISALKFQLCKCDSLKFYYYFLDKQKQKVIKSVIPTALPIKQQE